MSVSALDLFIRGSDALIEFDASFNEIKTHSKFSLEIEGSELKSLWGAVKSSYDNCLTYVATLKKTDESAAEVVRSKYQTTYRTYVECLSKMNSMIHNFEAESKLKEPSPVVGEIVVDNVCHNLTLPPCDTEVFEGNYVSWPTFRDLFTAVYIKNSRLSNIERLCHLVRKTKGEAREIVSKCPLSNEGFDIAWKNLSDAYDNPRMLVNDQLKTLFGLPYLDKETSAGLKSLQRGINGCLDAMVIYKISTESWDPIIVFLCLQRLPSLTVNLWEQSVRDKSALSPWEKLDQFLTERVQTLDCIRDLRGAETSKKSSEGRVKTHHANASSSSSTPFSSNNACPLCKNQVHFLRNCPQFKAMSIADRFSTVKSFRCCVNCLSKTHEARNCKSTHNCSICNKRHHTMLHREASSSGNTSRQNNSNSSTARQNTTNDNNPVPANTPTNFTPFNSSIQSTSNAEALQNQQVFHTSQNRSVILGTAMVHIIQHGTTYPARALIDPGSEASFISEGLQNRLKLSTHLTNAQISGVNQAVTANSRKICSLRIGSLLDPSILLETMALVLSRISGNLPSFEIPSFITDNLPNLRFADRNFYDSRPVDLLLGADLYPRIILGEINRDIWGSLLAQNTVFGWIVTGPVSPTPIQTYSTNVIFSEEDCLNRNLLRFWELEETPKRKMLSVFDKICEENYKTTTRRGSDGRYIVTLPFKPEFPQNLNLGISRTNVLRQYYRTESSLLRRPDIKEIYDNVVREYLDLDHMRLVSSPSTPTTYSCYLPHHPVVKPERKTTKLRVVFNASNKTSNSNSLNDCLYVGPTLQSDLVLLILRWRLFKFVFNCDITQMYRQIRVDPSHTPFQRILFRESPKENVKDYELQTVTFGVNCAPYLAIRTLLQLADDSEAEYPLASHILRKCMYVDDVLTGTHDVSTALIARDQLIAALSSAKFDLRKWTSNERSILDIFPPEHLVDAKLLTFVESSSSKTLGIQWNAQLDSFYFNVVPITHKTSHTKREVLSVIAKLFDPVGWLGPVVVVAKMIMQRVWLDNIGWDDSLPLSTENDWQKFLASYHEVNNIQIPRWVHYTPDCSVELHVFSDASEKAYAGVIYIRIKTPNGLIHTHLLSCKTKVAPIKSISIPRLELCGAVLGSELLQTVLSEIDIPLHQIYCWTDSTIVLSWLKKDPCSWTTFVANRVCKIQENVGQHNWYHVRSEDNPADLGSRGITPSELANNNLWWYGPHWLRLDKSLWNIPDFSRMDTDIDGQPIQTFASLFTDKKGENVYEDILENYSRLDKSLRVVSYMLRFFYNCHPAHRSGRYLCESKTLSSMDIRRSKLHLAKVAQKVHFSDEYKCLLDKKPLSPKSSLISLNPFLDKDSVMRLNGRLAKSPSLAYTEQHPIILPYEHRFTQLLTEFVHLISIHGGNQLMLRILRIEYWIPRLKSKIRGVISRCKRCVLDRKRSCSQIMAALPPERTVLDRPFTTTGVDFTGPFDIKSFTGRACKITKGYVCIFVCFSTKAIHLEATTDLSTATFLSAFQRFISRRGCPSTIFSDNGTNFVGASRELERDFGTFLKETQTTVLNTYGIQGLSWRFIPAGAPHMGGLWEAGVKSFKLHFRKEAQGFKYTFEELSTILARIEACLNSRPLCPMTDNPQEPVALTPGHFLIGSPILAPPESVIHDSPVSIVNRFRKMKALTQHFCHRWKNEYLMSLHKRYKWQHSQRDIKINDLVVIKHENLPPTSWRLGLVVKLYPGSDGHVRVADVRTANGVVRRAIIKLVILPN